jgi:hypothetical protein
VKYLKVTISGRYQDEIHYVALDAEEYTEAELMEIGQDCVNEQYSWGIGQRLLDESEVPEGER